MRHYFQANSNRLSNGRGFKGLLQVRPCRRRYISISTIPSGTLDELRAETPDISNAASPGAYLSPSSQNSADDMSGRCQIRGSGRSEFTPFGLLVGIPEPFHTSRHLSWCWRKGRECELSRVIAYSSFIQYRRLSQGSLCKSPSCVEQLFAFHFFIRSCLLRPL